MLPRGSAAAMPPAPALALPSWSHALAALALTLIAQATILHGLTFRGGVVSLTLLVVLWFAAWGGTGRGVLFGLIAGACEDAVAGATGAAWTFATPVAAAFAARIVRGTGWDHPLFLALVAGLAAIVRSVAFWLILRAEHAMPVLSASTVHAALWSAGLDAVVVAVLTVFRRVRPLRVERR